MPSASDEFTDNRDELTLATTSRSRRRRSATNDGPTTSDPARYKTELCRSYEETGGSCRYGDKCQFAHGVSELRTVDRHPRYKTQLCRTFHSRGFCAYGRRCHFIHNVDELQQPAGDVSKTAADVEQLQRLVEVQQRILDLTRHLPPQPVSQSHSTCQPGLVYPSTYSIPQSVRRTSAPADSGTPWMESRLRSQSLSSAGSSSSSSSSPRLSIPSSYDLDRLSIGCQSADPAVALIAETFFIRQPAFDV